MPMLLFGKKITTSISKSVLKRVVQFWFRRYRYFFTFFFLITLALGGIFWKNSILKYTWSEGRKKEYLNTHSREVGFQEQAFDRVRKKLGERDRLFNETPRFEDFFHTEYSNRPKKKN